MGTVAVSPEAKCWSKLTWEYPRTLQISQNNESVIEYGALPMAKRNPLHQVTLSCQADFIFSNKKNLKNTGSSKGWILTPTLSILATFFHLCHTSNYSLWVVEIDVCFAKGIIQQQKWFRKFFHQLGHKMINKAFPILRMFKDPKMSKYVPDRPGS